MRNVDARRVGERSVHSAAPNQLVVRLPALRERRDLRAAALQTLFLVLGVRGNRGRHVAGGGLVVGKRDGDDLVVGSDEPRDAATVSDVDAGENAVHKGDAHCGRSAVGLETKGCRKGTSSGPQEKRCSCMLSLHFFKLSEMKDSAEETEEWDVIHFSI